MAFLVRYVVRYVGGVCYARMDVTVRDKCGPASGDVLHYLWVVVICICCVRFIIKVRN